MPGMKWPTDVRERLSTRLRREARMQGLTGNEIARRGGMDPRTVRRVLSGHTMCWDTLTEVSRVMRLKLSEVLQAEGF
jgi:transcriptional regulator with XRE-family HTH domain